MALSNKREKLATAGILVVAYALAGTALLSTRPIWRLSEPQSEPYQKEKAALTVAPAPPTKFDLAHIFVPPITVPFI